MEAAEQKVHLFLFVKVRENWGDDPERYREMGLEFPEVNGLAAKWASAGNMEWSERGLVLGLKKHGETSVILELMTRGHGRHLGVVRGGRSKTMQPVLQPGNEVEAMWRARLERASRPLRGRSGGCLRTDLLMSSPQALHGVNWLGALLRLLPERDPHPGLYDRAQVLLAQIATPLAPALFVHFELAILAELGFGLDLDECAATGAP